MGVITISRQYGAGGKTLGQMVANSLGYTCIDNEIIQMVADKARSASHSLAAIEKEAGGRFLRFISGLVPKRKTNKVLGQELDRFDEAVYVDLLHKVITRIAQEGNAVIVGRGGQFVLKDLKNAIHILLVAELHQRIQFITQKYDLTPPQATQVVKQSDKRRLNLYKKMGREECDQPQHYQMVLNMSRLSLEDACRSICCLAQHC